MTREEMRERVARVLAEFQGEIHEGTWKYYLNDADAAIAIIRGETLEEAAKVADDGGSYDAIHIAAAIRALGAASAAVKEGK